MTNTGGDHWVYFGDGNAAQIIDSKEVISKKSGKKYVRFILIPSQRIEETYNISEEQDNSSGAIVRDYPFYDVIFLEKGIYRTRCWVFTDFDGKDTVVSRRHKDLTEALSDSDRLIRSANAAKNRAFQELDQERQQKTQSIRAIGKMMLELKKASGRGAADEGDSVDMDEGD